MGGIELSAAEQFAQQYRQSHCCFSKKGLANPSVPNQWQIATLRRHRDSAVAMKRLFQERKSWHSRFATPPHELYSGTAPAGHPNEADSIFVFK